MYRVRGWKAWSGVSHPNLLSRREDRWSTAAPSWIWVVRDIPVLQAEMGVMTRAQSSLTRPAASRTAPGQQQLFCQEGNQVDLGAG